VNYLAHIFLAGPEPEAQLGGLLGDFTKPFSGMSFGATAEREILIHRRIDSFTDAHPIVLAAKARFSPRARRFSGLVLDLLYDHFLADHWSEYCDLDLRRYIDRFCITLLNPPFVLPERLSKLAPALASEDWLGSYAEYGGFERAVKRLSLRLSKGAEQMLEGLTDVRRHLSAFEAGFQSFFPELQSYVQRKREELAVISTALYGEPH
jgi:acyl carrier protein phosphodiesterase